MVESVQKTDLLFYNNIGSTLSLLECMKENNVFKLIFSSSANVYDDKQLLPLKKIAKLEILKTHMVLLNILLREFYGSCKT